MPNILIFGGSGYIGSHVAYEFLKKNKKVIIFDNYSNSHKYITDILKGKFNDNLINIKADILNQNQLDEVFKKYKIDLVVNLASKISVQESNLYPLDYFNNNVKGLLNIITSMRKYDVKKIIFSSTASLYGNNKNCKILKEDDLLKPSNPYAISKFFGEEIIKNCSKKNGFSYIIFRFFNVAGANKDNLIGQHPIKDVYHLIPVISEVLLKLRDKIQIFGNDYPTKDGSCIRDYIHVEDIAQAHLKAYEYLTNNNENEIINLGTNEGISVSDMIAKVNEVFNINLPYEVIKRRISDPSFLVASNDKAKEKLNWSSKKTIEDMIISDYKWRKKINNI